LASHCDVGLLVIAKTISAGLIVLGFGDYLFL
jgi:hypothetical protein